MNSCDNVKVSFVIPARNEENQIGATLSSIQNGNQTPLDFEIIVVDHASTDMTATVATSNGARVISKVGGSVGEVRNTGVSSSVGDIIVFLDADVSLTPQWHEEFRRALQLLAEDYKVITGSHCLAPDAGSWLEKWWFSSFSQTQETTHLGTGHLIVTRKFFEEIGGFDPELITGEDYYFCKKAKAMGGKVINDEKLKVVHRDYPQNIKDFVLRESWHGMGDLKNMDTMLNSKVFLASLVFIALNAGIVLFAFTSSSLSIFLLVFLLVFLLMNSIYKFHEKGIKIIAINALIFYLYYLGRSFSIVRVASKKMSKV